MTEPITLKNGLTSEVVAIETANPLNYHHAIFNPNEVETLEIEGHMFYPKNKGPWPVVIVVPGSLGVSANNVQAVELLLTRNIASCLIDPFTARQVTSTVANQTQFSFAASAWDVLATAHALRTNPKIDCSKIGAQGHSRGGTAVLSAACMVHLVGRFSAISLTAIYAAYPWCGHQFLRPRVGSTIIRSIVGDQDEWCLPQQIQSYMQMMQLAGGQASWRIVQGAHHGFDRDIEVEVVKDSIVTPGAPTVFVERDGSMIHPLSGTPDPSLTERELMIYALKAGYGRKDVRIGAIGDQAKLFQVDMLDFWRDVLA